MANRGTPRCEYLPHFAHGDSHAAVIGASDADAISVRFDRPVEHVSPGQAVVLYNGDEVIGGGVIRPPA